MQTTNKETEERSMDTTDHESHQPDNCSCWQTNREESERQHSYIRYQANMRCSSNPFPQQDFEGNLRVT